MFTKLHFYLKHLTKKQKVKWSLFIVFLIWFYFLLPSKLFTAPTCFVVKDKNNELLSATIAADGQWRFPFNHDVPQKFIDCITTFEDKRFYYHPGVDPISIGRAIKQNFGSAKRVSGGSTLTMQVMRLYYKNNKRNFYNKCKEMIMAIRLECSYRKKTILALYASNAPFGSNVVGLDAASWRYFGRDAQQLSWGEMAALAVLPNAPSLVHPSKNRNELLRKRNALLDKLLHNKTIDENTCILAKLEPLPGEPKPLPQIAPHILSKFISSYKNEDETAVSLLQTTLDATLQKQVTELLQTHQQSFGGTQIKNAAAMVMEVESGNILAYVGNVYNIKDSSTESYVDVLQSNRSPGSTLKPLLYASMLTEGQIMPKQLIPDVPTQFNGYTPQNFDLGYDGAVPANRALARSLNIPAVKMLQQFKYQKMYSYLKSYGFTTLTKPAEHYGMSLILGGCEVKPFELAGVYSSMARMYMHEQKNNGLFNQQDWFMPLYNKATKKVIVRNQLVEQVVDYPSIWHTLNAMNEVMRPGEEGLWSLFSSSQKIAWKTGTSFGFRDAWAIGLTPKYCVVVWMGNTTGEGSSALVGINAAAPLMFQIFRNLPTSAWFQSPQTNQIREKTCAQSGFKAGLDCEKIDYIMVSKNAVNAPVCPYCKTISTNAEGNFRVNANCFSPANMSYKKWFVLPPTMEYYYIQKHPDYKLLPPFYSNCINESNKVLDFLYPDENAIIYVPLELNGSKGKTIFKAVHRVANSKLFWHLDNDFLTTTQQFHEIAINPTVGKHVLTVVDENGNSMSRSFEIANK
ncbi:MAG: penicillin-binding protein 1C [Chitinophagaceae bacterium]